MQKRPALEQLLADWHDHAWPTATLALFRMEGEGGDAGGDGGQGGDGAAGDGGQGDTGDDVAKLQAELDKWKTQSRKHEERAKANAAAQAELDKVKQSQMSEQEKAVAQARAEAKAEGKAEAVAELGPRLIAAEIRGAAAGPARRRPADDPHGGHERCSIPRPTRRGRHRQGDQVGRRDRTQGRRGRRTASRPSSISARAHGGGRNKESLNGDPLVGALKSKLGMR
jgi:hypothetical protein